MKMENGKWKMENGKCLRLSISNATQECLLTFFKLDICRHFPFSISHFSFVVEESPLDAPEINDEEQRDRTGPMSSFHACS